MLVGAPTHTPMPAVEALVRWDPGWFAGRELADRAALGLPPLRRAAVVQGERVVVAGFVDSLDLPADVVVLGPTPVEEMGQPTGRATPPRAQAILLGPLCPASDARAGTGLASALRVAKAARSARKEGGGLTVRLDPRDLG